jgi:Flp pilus assembly protein TadG
MMRRRIMGRDLIRLCRESGGTAAVEFALVLPIMLTIILGGFEFGRVYWARHTLQYAAEETGRYAMAHTTATATQLTSYAKTNMPGLDPAAATVAVTPDSVGSTSYITITVTAPFDFVIPFVDLSPLTLTGTTRVPLLS